LLRNISFAVNLKSERVLFFKTLNGITINAIIRHILPPLIIEYMLRNIAIGISLSSGLVWFNRAGKNEFFPAFLR